MNIPNESAPSSIYRNQSVRLKAIFDEAKSPSRVLCVPLDFAKAKHVALICDGNGDVLKRPFPLHNSAEGVDFLDQEIQATARRRKIAKKHIFQTQI